MSGHAFFEDSASRKRFLRAKLEPYSTPQLRALVRRLREKAKRLGDEIPPGPGRDLDEIAPALEALALIETIEDVIAERGRDK